MAEKTRLAELERERRLASARARADQAERVERERREENDEYRSTIRDAAQADSVRRTNDSDVLRVQARWIDWLAAEARRLSGRFGEAVDDRFEDIAETLEGLSTSLVSSKQRDRALTVLRDMVHQRDRLYESVRNEFKISRALAASAEHHELEQKRETLRVYRWLNSVGARNRFTVWGTPDAMFQRALEMCAKSENLPRTDTAWGIIVLELEALHLANDGVDDESRAVRFGVKAMLLGMRDVDRRRVVYDPSTIFVELEDLRHYDGSLPDHAVAENAPPGDRFVDAVEEQDEFEDADVFEDASDGDIDGGEDDILDLKDKLYPPASPTSSTSSYIKAYDPADQDEQLGGRKRGNSSIFVSICAAVTAVAAFAGTLSTA